MGHKQFRHDAREEANSWLSNTATIVEVLLEVVSDVSSYSKREYLPFEATFKVVLSRNRSSDAPFHRITEDIPTGVLCQWQRKRSIDCPGPGFAGDSASRRCQGATLLSKGSVLSQTHKLLPVRTCRSLYVVCCAHRTHTPNAEEHQPGA